MASLIYTSAPRDAFVGNIAFATDTFKAMLVTSAYTADKDHTKRNQVTNEVTGTGYAAGGIVVTCTVGAVDTVNDRFDVTFSNPSWAAVSITARGAVIYKSRGGASSADELVAYCDFGSDITSTNSTFVGTITSPFRVNN